MYLQSAPICTNVPMLSDSATHLSITAFGSIPHYDIQKPNTTIGNSAGCAKASQPFDPSFSAESDIPNTARMEGEIQYRTPQAGLSAPLRSMLHVVWLIGATYI